MKKKQEGGLITNVPKMLREVQKHIKKVQKALENYEEPYCEITQNQEGILINVKMPKVSKGCINLQVSERVIEVKGRSKRYKKNYYRRIDIPLSVDSKKIRAAFAKETLKMKMPYMHSIQG